MDMSVLYTYLRDHPWQRRVLTLLVAVSVSGLAAIVAHPHVRNHALRRNLGSPDDTVQRVAIHKARGLMAVDESVRRYLEAVTAAADCDDRTFLAATTAMLDEAMPNVSCRPAEQADRYRALMLELAPLGQTRRGLAWQLLVGGRVNEHTRRAAAMAAKDEDASVRTVGAALAAKAGDESSLRALLADDDPNVVALAALDAGLTGHTALAADIMAAMESQWERAAGRAARTAPTPAITSGPAASGLAARSAELDGDLEVISNAAFALARLAPQVYSGLLAEVLLRTDDPLLRARLLYVMPMLRRDVALRAVSAVLANPPNGKPEAAAMLAGASLGLQAETEQAVRAVLAAVSGEGASAEQLRAACQVAVVLELDVGNEVYSLLEDLWTARDVPLRNLLVQLLAAHARRLEAHPPAQTVAPAEGVTLPVTRAECLAMLSTIVQIGPEDLANSIPAAVAAWELLALNHPDAWDYVKEAAASSPLAAFELACRMAHDEDPGRYMDLALNMLPDPRRPSEDGWAFDTNVKITAAAWMGLAKLDDNAIAQARQRILLRYNTVRNPYLRQTYDAALLTLGQRNLAAAAREAFNGEALWVESNMLFHPDGRFPQFLPVYGALLVKSGDRRPLDWLLAGDGLNLTTQAFLLQGMGMAHVVRLDTDLPGIDPASSGDLQLWQVNILRHTYLLRGAGVPPARGDESDSASSSDQPHGTHNAGETTAPREQP